MGNARAEPALRQSDSKTEGLPDLPRGLWGPGVRHESTRQEKLLSQPEGRKAASHQKGSSGKADERGSRHFS